MLNDHKYLSLINEELISYINHQINTFITSYRSEYEIRRINERIKLFNELIKLDQYKKIIKNQLHINKLTYLGHGQEGMVFKNEKNAIYNFFQFILYFLHYYK